ncbi:MAG TPA: peptidylprolyl isomerase [Actinomycetota bacterium]|nr:peptidylprolyl isomerase [Actinomycetota bacterium]
MPSRARDRQLAKQHARRQAERHAAERRRKVTAGVFGAVIGIVAIVAGSFILLGDDDDEAATAPTPSASASASPSGDGGGGRVTLVVAPPETVACGADVPSRAGKPKRQYAAAPAVEDTIDPEATYTATIETSCGTVVVDLFADVAPQAVASFVFLADEGFFDGLTFHRILPGFVVQGGDPLGDGTGGPGYQFVNETDRKVTFDREGLLAMANSGPDTNGSQFFVTLGPAEHLDGGYTIFGEVTEGMDAVEAIAGVPLVDEGTGSPAEAVYIGSVTIEATN